MELECLMCKTRPIQISDQYFCSDCKDSYTEIEILLTHEHLDSCRLDEFELKTGPKSLKKRKMPSMSHERYENVKENESTASKQISKVFEASTDDQSSPDERTCITHKFDSIMKLGRNSKKINKDRNLIQSELYRDKRNLWRIDQLDNSSNCSNPTSKNNYSSLGNESCNNSEPNSICLRSASEAPTELRCNSFLDSEAFQAPNKTSVLKNSDWKYPNLPELDSIDLIFDESSDELENNIKELGNHGISIAQLNKRIDVNEQEDHNNMKNKIGNDSSSLIHKDDKFELEEQLAEPTLESVSLLAEQRNHLIQVEDKHIEQLANVNTQPNTQDRHDGEDQEKEEVMIGEKYQCSIPSLMDQSQIQQNKRSFKFVSGPSVIDPKVVEVIESYIYQDLKVTRISTEKLILMLRKFDFKIPEFFSGLLRDKENSKNRIIWKKERSKVF